ncbi:isoprenoid synthase domain-containing protein [Melanogaster broomeanus]|nr:isoprenoid synthase domain-containing protein [Melanogaster broomeanus]
MSPATTDTTTRRSELSPASFVLPDLVSDCPYPLRINPHFHDVARASGQWMLEGARLVEPRATKFLGLKAGELGAVCYPNADASHLRVCLDFLNWSFDMDDWLEGFNVDDTWGMRDCYIAALRDPIHFQTEKLGAKMAKSFFGRFIQTSGPGCTERFICTMDLSLIAAAKQAANRANGHIPDLKSYTALRRDASGCKPCFALIEYAARIDLPDEVVSHPVILGLEEAANDFVSWSNDIFSYNVEQSRREPHNLIAVLMHHRGIGLQGAVDHAGALCKGAIQRFEENRAILPSWGEEVDQQVAIYIEGLQDWMVGSLHWSFESERYFKKEGPQVKQTRIVKLRPKARKLSAVTWLFIFVLRLYLASF